MTLTQDAKRTMEKAGELIDELRSQAGYYKDMARAYQQEAQSLRATLEKVLEELGGGR